MNKTTIIGIVIAVIVVLGGVGLYFMNKSSTSDTSTQESTTNVTTDTSSSNRASLRSLMGLAKNQQCTFTDNESGSEGTVYVTNDKMRGDFTAISEGETIGSHVIIIGEDMYLWMDGSGDGYKSSISDTENADEEAGQQERDTESSGLDINNEVTYKCQPWVVDASKFELPQDINFRDLGTMMEEMETTMQEQSETNCQSCDNLPPGEAQDQCRQALGC
jgi:hypothetical protein